MLMMESGNKNVHMQIDATEDDSLPFARFDQMWNTILFRIKWQKIKEDS